MPWGLAGAYRIGTFFPQGRLTPHVFMGICFVMFCVEIVYGSCRLSPRQPCAVIIREEALMFRHHEMDEWYGASGFGGRARDAFDRRRA